jgi:hypothetical protein
MAQAGLYYKGLMEEKGFFPYTAAESADKAEDSWYKVWFDILKASPWYTQICDGQDLESTQANRCFELFGDLRNITFQEWWMERGYQIFAEPVDYQDIVAREVTENTHIEVTRKRNEPPKLVLEVPLNVDPRHLEDMFKKILRQHSDCYFSMKNRWESAQADARLHVDSKIDKRSIYLWLEVFAEVQKGELTQAEICRKLKLNPRLFKDFGKGTLLDAETTQKASNETSKYLKKIKRLMAHATEMTFPCIDDHRWAVDGRRGQ